MEATIDRDLLAQKAEELGISLKDEALDRFETYARMLVEWNQRINLTAITRPDEIVIKHFADSLTVANLLPEGEISLIDVGTGAGFPGVPLGILRSDIKLTLLDSLNKRLVYLKELCAALEIPATLIHARAEEAGQKQEYREKFDVAVARAVAALPILCEYCLPFVKIGGSFIAMKGRQENSETVAAKSAASALGGKLTRAEKIILQNEDENMERCLLLFDKYKATSSKYPRIAAKIKKQPL
ncbi:MAG: 16S rRNA (guanine(527)-N(7))-methyltransferase RsmG [Oscillospiraceae bacterium]|nr:16S rRNA (guanine(527)-N(7))-methyltransferase RsmG [Oscillospiraceae bacterium]MDD4414671.1 16S rRNA (guanine(527)-N(7))-methyltransferase RsmG [Oscillospiraceae bacterium]